MKIMYSTLLKQYKTEIIQHYTQALMLEKLLPNQEFTHNIYTSAIINMCIKYETLTAHLDEVVFKKQPRYNHPWAHTRNIAQRLSLNIAQEYKVAHDAWDLYNSLKHVNTQTEVEQSKLFAKYKIKNMQAAVLFVKNALVNLINALGNLKQNPV